MFKKDLGGIFQTQQFGGYRTWRKGLQAIFGSVDLLLKWVISFLSVSQESQQLDITSLELWSSDVSLSQSLKGWNSSLLFWELSHRCGHWNGAFMLLHIQEFKSVPSTKLRE